MEDKQIGFWAKHRITTRLISMAIVYAYIYSVRAKEPSEDIIFTTGLFALIALIVLTFGLNSITKVTSMIKAWKGK